MCIDPRKRTFFVKGLYRRLCFPVLNQFEKKKSKVYDVKKKIMYKLVVLNILHKV